MQDEFPYLQAPAGYVFIVTYGRSGSTLLQHLLNRLPGYCIRGENSDALRPLFQSVQRLRNGPGPRPGGVEDGVTSHPTHPWFGIERIDAQRYAASLADAFVREVLALPQGTRIGGFKEIRFAADPASFKPYLNFMANTFPNARFIFNTRAHAEVARSGWWARKDPTEVFALLKAQEQQFGEYMAANPHMTLLLKYNDYVTDHDVFRRLFDFLEEPYDAELVKGVMSQELTHAKFQAPSDGKKG